MANTDIPDLKGKTIKSSYWKPPAPGGPEYQWYTVMVIEFTDGSSLIVDHQGDDASHLTASLDGKDL